MAEFIGNALVIGAVIGIVLLGVRVARTLLGQDA